MVGSARGADVWNDAGPVLGRQFVEAVAARDWAGLRAWLAPTVAFRALVPNEADPFRDWKGPDDTIAQLQRWFDDSDVLELERHDVEGVADKTRVTYLFHGHDDNEGWYHIEQHAYFEVDDGQITRIDLVCSGFREVPAPA
jgi:SnoaL-like domain